MTNAFAVYSVRNINCTLAVDEEDEEERRREEKEEEDDDEENGPWKPV